MGWFRRNGIKAIRNNTGAFRTESGGYVRFGDKGSPDIIARVPVTLNGVKFATMLAVECKSNTGTLSADQKSWRDAHIADGGIYIVARSVDDLIGGMKHG